MLLHELAVDVLATILLCICPEAAPMRTTKEIAPLAKVARTCRAFASATRNVMDTNIRVLNLRKMNADMRSLSAALRSGALANLTVSSN